MSNLPIEKLKVDGQVYDIVTPANNGFIYQLDNHFYMAKDYNDLPENVYYGSDGEESIYLLTYNHFEVRCFGNNQLTNVSYDTIHPTDYPFDPSIMAIYNTYEDAEMGTNALPYEIITLLDAEVTKGIFAFAVPFGKTYNEIFRREEDDVIIYPDFGIWFDEEFGEEKLSYKGYKFDIRMDDVAVSAQYEALPAEEE